MMKFTKLASKLSVNIVCKSVNNFHLMKFLNFLYKNLIFTSIMLIITCILTKDWPRVTSHVIFEVMHGNENLGKIKIGLFGEIVPKTVANFMLIAKKYPTETDPMTYNGTIFHRIVQNFIIQGGDFEYNDGSGSYSIYGRIFPDENFKIPHRLYVVSMSNYGPDSNGAQFFITTAETQWLNGRNVVFGCIVDGQDVVQLIESVEVGRGHKPIHDVMIIGVEVEENIPPYVIHWK